MMGKEPDGRRWGNDMAQPFWHSRWDGDKEHTTVNTEGKPLLGFAEYMKPKEGTKADEGYQVY